MAIIFIGKDEILRAKTKLGDRNAEIIATLLNVEKYDEVNKKGICPFHLEDTPSFIYNPKAYCFKCFGCGKNTDVIDAYMHIGKTYLEAVEELFKEANIPYAFGEKGVKTKNQYIYPKLEPLNEKANVYRYLGQRRISKETIDKTDIREDKHGNIVFNFYDTNDVLTLVKYRPSHKIDKSKGEIKSWCQKDAGTTPLLFNMNRVNTNQPLLITEGEIDCLAAIEAGYTNSVSVPLGANNYGWIEENFDWLEQFDTIIICSDNDEAGLKMQKECIFRLGSWRTKFIDIPPKHIDENGEEIYMKDINHVLYYEGKQAVMNLILNAKDSPVPSVNDLSNVTDVDLDEIDGIKTGIKQLDSKLMRLFYGTLTIVSGKPGSGKTSFLSQLLCQSLDQDKNIWIFSREMPGWMTKSWLNYILAGNKNIKEYKNSDDGCYYKVTQQAKDDINKYYQNKWVVYKDDASNKFDDVITSMTDSVRKYGSKLLIVDNLMTLDLGCNENNEMIKQTDCINKLIYFAVKFNVAVVLVAHPRKMERGADVDIYDISGTANIINLAHRTIGLKRLELDNPKNPNNYNVEASLIKDRMTGASGRFGMYYDKPSRRFYTNKSEYNFQYKWDASEHKELPYPHSDEEVFGKIKQGDNK